MAALLLSPFLAFVFVLSRVSGLVMTAPLFGSRDIPMRVRAFLAFALALVITPLQIANAPRMPGSVIELAVSLAGELMVGLVLGLGVMIVMSGVQVAGQVISQMSGMSLADVFNPGFDAEVPLFSHLLYMVTLAVFVLIGGQRLLVAALLDTYSAMPLGETALPADLGGLTSTLLAESFSLAVRGAAPAMVALLLATIVLGLISRTLPQLNILALGFGLNAVVTFVVVSFSLGVIAWLFQQQFEPAVEIIVDSLRTTSTT